MYKGSKVNLMWRLAFWPLVASLLSTGLAALFLVALIRFSPDQTRHFLIFLAALFPVLFIATRVMVRPRNRDISRYWNSCLAGARLSDEAEIRRIYARVMNHPRFLFLQGVTFWAAGTVLTAVYMTLFEGVTAHDALKICFSGISTGVLSSLFIVHIAKQVLAPLRASFHVYHHVEGLAEGVSPISLRTKLLATFVPLIVVTLTFSALMTHERVQGVMKQTRVDAWRPAFESLLLRLSKLPVSEIAHVDFGALVRGENLPPGSAAALFDAEDKRIAFTGEGKVAGGAAIEDQVAGHDWRLALYLPAAPSALPDSNLQTILVVQLLLSMAIAIGLAVFGANELSRSIQEMARWSRRVASGDLGTPLRLESEDELGKLAHFLSNMSLRLRGMILHVKDTAAGVERMSGEVSAVTRDVTASSDEQCSSVLEATSVFEEINASIRGIAEHTEHLSVSAEESSSSILEMGATVEEVSGNMESLNHSVDEAVASMEQMTSAIREVTRNVEGLSEVAEGTSASMEEIAASVKQVEENATDTRRLAVEMVKAAEVGSQRVLATISGIEAIRAASEEAQQVITSLGRRAEEIGEILNVIDEVAEETNLLALNAAIIAAQAGEHGRGFSVVADEIKDLADRVGASSKEIGKLIRAVQQESGNAVSAVRSGGEMVAEGERLSRDAGMALEEIMANARTSGEMIDEIAQATTEQARGSQSVVVAMEQVREMVLQIRGAMGEQSRGSEQVMRASMSMRGVTQQVTGTIHEQARGSGRITASIENIREMVQQINGAIQEQRRGTEQAVVALDHIRGRAEHNQGAAAKMARVVEGMVTQADVLKTEVSRFRIEEDQRGQEPGA